MPFTQRMCAIYATSLGMHTAAWGDLLPDDGAVRAFRSQKLFLKALAMPFGFLVVRVTDGNIRHIGVIERTTSDVDSHAPHPHMDYPGLRCHKDITREAFRKFKHDGIPPHGTVLVAWQTKKNPELIPTKLLTLTDRCVVVGDVVKKDPRDAMSGTVRQTSMTCEICPGAFKKVRLVDGEMQRLQEDAVPFQVSADDIRLANDYREGDLIVYNGWVGCIEEVQDEVSVRLSNGSIVAVEDSTELDNPLDINDTRLDVGAIVRTIKGNLRRGRWVVGRYDPEIEPIGDVVKVEPLSFQARWMWKFGSTQPAFDRSEEPPIQLSVPWFESAGGKIYDHSRSPREAGGLERSHTAFISGDRVRFKDMAGAAVKYPQFKRIPTSDTNGFDLNVFTLLQTKTVAKVVWQDQSEEVVAGTSVVPDYNIDDDNEVWPGEIVISNEKEQTDEDWVFQPKRVGVVQSVSPAERIAQVKWLPKAHVSIPLSKILSPSQYFRLGPRLLGLDIIPR
jgi:ubiquitin-conjugating enzyme E2 O